MRSLPVWTTQPDALCRQGEMMQQQQLQQQEANNPFNHIKKPLNTFVLRGLVLRLRSVTAEHILDPARDAVAQPDALCRQGEMMQQQQLQQQEANNPFNQSGQQQPGVSTSGVGVWFAR
jgi:hypothetical protein